MKKACLCFLMLLPVCFLAKSEDLKQGDQITKHLVLEFNEEAMESNAFVSWKLIGDWDKFDCHFSQGELKNDIFTINAVDYKKFVDGQEGVALTVSGKNKTKQGDYSLGLRVQNMSEGMEVDKDELELTMNVTYLLPPPPPLWRKLLPWIIALVLMFLIVILVLHFEARFPNCLLQVGKNEINLKGKKIVSVKDELNKINIETPRGVDIILQKKRFMTFQGPVIKQMINCNLKRGQSDYMSIGDVILPYENIHGLKDINGNDMLIKFIN